jgi:hypothetical protein
LQDLAEEMEHHIYLIQLQPPVAPAELIQGKAVEMVAPAVR